MGRGKKGEREGKRRGKGKGCPQNGRPGSATEQIWHLGAPLGAIAPCHTFLDSYFQG